MLTLSGQFETEAIAELTRLLERQQDYGDVILDLKDVSVVSRNVMHFLLSCESKGVALENCPSYIREWMERERD